MWTEKIANKIREKPPPLSLGERNLLAKWGKLSSINWTEDEKRLIAWSQKFEQKRKCGNQKLDT